MTQELLAKLDVIIFGLTFLISFCFVITFLVLKNVKDDLDEIKKTINNIYWLIKDIHKKQRENND